MGSELVASCNEYEYKRAEWIACEYAGGATLRELSNLHPDVVPSPLVLARWRKLYPAFDLLMREASNAKAQVLADETIALSDDRVNNAAQTANSIRARQWLAARLDRDTYGDAKQVTLTQGASNEGLATYTDAELQAIIAGALRESSVDGEAERVETATPVSPPGENRTGLEDEDGGDIPEPKIFRQVGSVTSNDSSGDVRESGTGEASGEVE